MSNNISFDENISPSDSGSSYRGVKRAPIGDFGNQQSAGKGMTQWLMEKLSIKSETTMNVIMIVIAIAIFALSGYIFMSALS